MDKDSKKTQLFTALAGEFSCYGSVQRNRILAITLIIIYFEKIFYQKRNASTSLGIDPKTFRLPVECSVIWAKKVPHNFSRRIYLRLFGYGYIMNYLLIFPNHYHGEWYTLLIIDIIDWNYLEKLVNSFW